MRQMLTGGAVARRVTDQRADRHEGSEEGAAQMAHRCIVGEPMGAM